MALSNLHTNYKVSYKDDLMNLTKERENPETKSSLSPFYLQTKRIFLEKMKMLHDDTKK